MFWISQPLLGERRKAIEPRVENEASDVALGFNGFALGWYFEGSEFASGDFLWHLPQVSISSECLIIGWVRLTNRVELVSELGLEPTPDGADIGLVLKAWERWKHESIPLLRGSFAFTAVSRSADSAIGVRDALGTKPLFSFRTASQMGFSGSIRQVTDVSGFIPRLDIGWASSWLHGRIQASRTALQGIQEIRPGTFLEIRSDGESETRYHRFSTHVRWESRRDEKHLERYRHALQQAIEADIPPATNRLGLELSGGIDSASLLIGARSVIPSRDDLLCLGYVVREQEKELLDLMKIDFPGHRYKVFQGADLYLNNYEKARQLGTRVLGYPAEYPNSLAHMTIFDYMQRKSRTVLFSGFGGDEGVSAEAWSAHDEAWKRGKWILASRWAGRNTLSQITRYIGRRILLGDLSRRSTWEEVEFNLQFSPLNDEAIGDLKVARHLHSDASDRVKLRSVNNQIVHRLQSPHVAKRMSEGFLIAASFGIDYRYPLLNPGLLQSFLEIPTVWKRGGNVGRFLHRSAVSGLAPDEIVWNPTKDTGPVVSMTPRVAEFPDPEAYVNALWDRTPEQLRELLDRKKLESFAAPHETEITGILSREALMRVDDLGAWMTEDNVGV